MTNINTPTLAELEVADHIDEPAERPTLTDDQPSNPVRRKKTGLNRWVVHGLQLLVVVVVLVVWQFGSGTIIDPVYVGTPVQTWQALVLWWSDGTLLSSSIITFRETLIGFVIGCVSGMLLGFLLGVSVLAGRVFNPFVVALNTIPKLALAPLFLLWFGLGEPSKVALAALLVFFLVFMNTYAGVRDVDHDLIDVMRVMGATRMTIYRRVTFPSALVWVIAGLRVSVPYAFLGAVVGEMFAAQYGLGALIQRASSNFNPSAMIAAIIILIVMATLLNVLVGLLEKRLLRWKTPS